MRAAWIDAERAAEVRNAARDWKQAGAIDAAALAAIETEFPHQRLELARPWKVMIFLFVSVAILGVQLGVFGFENLHWGRFFVYATLLAVATEVLRGSRLAGTGSDAATSFWAVMNLIVGFGVLIDLGQTDTEVTATLAVAALAFALACWRWGFWVYAAFASFAGFVFLARFPSGRLMWIGVGVALAALSVWLADRPHLGPSRRRAFAGVFVVAALALYAAINLYSRDERLVERTRSWVAAQRLTEAQTGPRPLFAAATAVVPIVFIVWGLLARRRLVLDTGAGLAALSLLTLYYYFRFGSVAITLFGLVLIGVALWLNRRLARAPGEEIRGFTASPRLCIESEATGPASALVAAAAAATAISEPQPERGFSPGGGRSGGGGATGTI